MVDVVSHMAYLNVFAKQKLTTIINYLFYQESTN